MSAPQVHIGSKNRLTARMAARFQGATLFDEIARTLCSAGVLPRKELYESWQVAKRTARRFRGGRIVELCAGHGLVSAMLLLLDPSAPSALSVEARVPKSADRIRTALLDRWPALAERWRMQQADLDTVALDASDTVVAVHACGDLSDRVITRALAARARLALLPCCHAVGPDSAFLAGWLDGPLAVDALRAVRLSNAGYRVLTQTIDPRITPKNRLLLAAPQ